MMQISEQINYHKFNSKAEGLYLLERTVKAPKEKKAVEDLPHSQGEQDYSMITGERKFSNRQHTYVFLAPHLKYPQRKILEQNVRRKTLMSGIAPLYDTHDLGYFWQGKCDDVKVEDDHKYNCLRVTLVFNLYPFMLSEKNYFDDVWDDFDLDNGVANYTKYEINGERDIVIYNNGDITVSPVIHVEVGDS